MEQSLSQMTSAARMGTALGLGLDAVPSGGVVFLVGFMGCGKTTVGRRLATLLQGSFVDLDEYIERAAGRTIPDLFRLEGEAGFRRREQAALVQLCAALANDPTPWKVVALGGGTFTVEANRDCVRRNGCSVWLDVPFEVLAARIMRDGGRPLWTSQADAEWRYWRRRADYAHADIHLPVGDRTPDQAAAAIAQALAAWQNLRP